MGIFEWNAIKNAFDFLTQCDHIKSFRQCTEKFLNGFVTVAGNNYDNKLKIKKNN